MDKCSLLLASLKKQGSDYYNKAEYYHDRGELEGALIHYKMSALALYNVKSLFPEELDDKLSCIFRDDLSKIKPLQEESRKRKMQCSGRDKEDTEVKCDDISNLVLKGQGCINFSDIAGLDKAKESIKDGLLYPLVYPKLYPKVAKGILFYGPPGVGKTLIAKAAVNQLQEMDPNVSVLFFNPTGASLKGKYVGETEKNIEKYFKCASEHASTCREELTKPGEEPKKVISVLFIDEIDSIAGDRSADQSGMMTNSVNALLQQMDGIEATPNVSVIAATNYPWDLDDAVMRRFTKRILIGLPSPTAIGDIIRINIDNYIRIFAKEFKIEPDDLRLKKGKGKGKLLCVAGECSKRAAEKRNLASTVDKKACPEFDKKYLYQQKRYSQFMKITETDIANIAIDLYEKKYSSSDVSSLCNQAFVEVANRAKNHRTFYKIPELSPDKEDESFYSLRDADCKELGVYVWMTTLCLPPKVPSPQGDNLLILNPPQFKSIIIDKTEYLHQAFLPQETYIADSLIKDVYINQKSSGSKTQFKVLFSNGIDVVDSEGNSKLETIYAISRFEISDKDRGKEGWLWWLATGGPVSRMLESTEVNPNLNRLINPENLISLMHLEKRIENNNNNSDVTYKARVLKIPKPESQQFFGDSEVDSTKEDFAKFISEMLKTNKVEFKDPDFDLHSNPEELLIKTSILNDLLESISEMFMKSKRMGKILVKDVKVTLERTTEKNNVTSSDKSKLFSFNITDVDFWNAQKEIPSSINPQKLTWIQEYDKDPSNFDKKKTQGK